MPLLSPDRQHSRSKSLSSLSKARVREGPALTTIKFAIQAPIPHPRLASLDGEGMGFQSLNLPLDKHFKTRPVTLQKYKTGDLGCHESSKDALY